MNTPTKVRIAAWMLSFAMTFACVGLIAAYALPPAPAGSADVALPDSTPQSNNA